MAVILVTGGNRGIGLGIVEAVAKRLSDATILIGCRSIVAGEEAIQKLSSLGLAAEFSVVQIDIEDDVSITNAVSEVEKNYGKLDGMLMT